ncbi:MAG: hypothetical protein AB7V42_09990 [Thermoleophilia bacterium]
MTELRRRGRWLLAGGIVGLALAPGARRAGRDLRDRVARLGHPGVDPVERFLDAPCYRREDVGAAAGSGRTEAAGT